MARGWESKSIADQQADADARRQAPAGRPASGVDRERQARRMTLGLSRARVLQDLQTACHPNHRAMLEEALVFIDRELDALDR